MGLTLLVSTGAVQRGKDALRLRSGVGRLLCFCWADRLVDDDGSSSLVK